MSIFSELLKSRDTKTVFCKAEIAKCACGKGYVYFDEQSKFKDFPKDMTLYLYQAICPDCYKKYNIESDQVGEFYLIQKEEGGEKFPLHLEETDKSQDEIIDELGIERADIGIFVHGNVPKRKGVPIMMSQNRI